MVKRKESGLTSGNKITVFLRAGKNSGVTHNAEPHEEFANLRDEESAIRFFIDRWGPVLADSADTFGKYGGPNHDLRNHLRAAWEGSERSLLFVQDSVGRYMRSTWAFKDGQIEIVADDLWSTICILFLRDRAADKTGTCQNPNCPAKYFIKKRSTQKFCESGACVAYAQRQYALKWWNEEGKQLREKRRKKAQRKAGK